MPLPKASAFNDMRGFTLVEIIVTLTLASIFMSFIVEDGIRSYMIVLRDSDARTIMTALLVARSAAMNGICSDASTCSTGAAHGVHIDERTATAFEGSSYANRYASADRMFPLSGMSEIHSTISGDMVFAPISGDSQDATITVRDEGVSYSIYVLHSGIITATSL